jgi:hypothetical protein
VGGEEEGMRVEGGEGQGEDLLAACSALHDCHRRHVQAIGMNLVVDLVSYYLIAKKLKITVLVFVIFVSIRNVQAAGVPVKLIQLCANKRLDVLEDMVSQFQRLSFAHSLASLIFFFFLGCASQSTSSEAHLQLLKDLLGWKLPQNDVPMQHWQMPCWFVFVRHVTTV